jgi:hypothetical protein
MTSRSIILALALVAGVSGCTRDAAPSAPTIRLALVAGADHGGAPFSTALTQELTTSPVWSGDPDGTGEALLTVNLGQREICWQLSVTAITLPATASHIHRAAPGVRGGIVVPLSAPDGTGASAGCASGLDPALLHEILTSPASFYVNVHTADFPPGALRGQLDR